MRSTRSSVLALALAALGLAALASAAVGGGLRSGEPPQRGVAAKGVKLKLKDSPYGRVLFANGFAMYVFTKDKGRKSRCYGKCAKAWPPLRARGEVVAGAGVKKKLIGKAKRRGGRRQLTYAGQPLYAYEHDPRGRVLCHDVREFGGTWYAVLRSGERAP